MLRTIRRFAILLAAGLVACADGADPMETTRSERPSANVAGASGCYTVKFDVLAVPSGIPFVFNGQITGDLEGTVIIAFDLSTFKFAGVTGQSAGTAQWTITGGIVTGLTGFTTSFDNLSFEINTPGSPTTISETSGRHRALSGVQKANLSYTGLLQYLPSFHADLDFHGVICS